MPRGGKRPGAGRPRNAFSKRKVAVVVERPGVTRVTRADGRYLDSLDVMRDNMRYFYEEADKILAIIMALPADGSDVTKLEALLKFADVHRFRLQSQQCAEAIAKYEYHPKGAKPYEGEDGPKEGEKPEVFAENPQLRVALESFRTTRGGLKVVNGGRRSNGKG